MLSNYLILCHSLLLLPSIFPSIRVFSNESILCIRWPKCWSFSFSISPTNEHSGLITYRMDWLDLPAVQGTLKSLLQHHSSEALILQHSAFFIVQLSHSYMTNGKSIALTRQTFLPDPEIKPGSPALQADSLPTEPKESSNYHIIALISCTNQAMLQARLQKYVNRQFPEAQAGFRKGRRTRDEFANICWIIEKTKRIPEEHLLH